MLKQDLDPLFFLDDQDGSASSSSTPPPPNRRPIAPSSHSSRLATHPAYISHSHLQIQRSRSPSSSSLTTPPSMAKKVHDMKDEMKYLLGKHSLILSDVYEYNAHKRSAIDFRHDAVAICRALLGDDQAISSHFSPYGDMFGSWKHRIETLRFPRRDIVDPQAIQSYLSAILAIKRQLLSFVDCYYCSTKPIEIVLSVDPKDVLVGDSHVCLPLLLSSDLRPTHSCCLRRWSPQLSLSISQQPTAALPPVPLHHPAPLPPVWEMAMGSIATKSSSTSASSQPLPLTIAALPQLLPVCCKRKGEGREITVRCPPPPAPIALRVSLRTQTIHVPLHLALSLHMPLQAIALELRSLLWSAVWICCNSTPPLSTDSQNTCNSLRDSSSMKDSPRRRDSDRLCA
jgi:hypothetical protein